MLSTAMLYFRETARAGSLRRAAEQLGVAPSAISRQIAKLEGELQTALLDRRANRTTLTAGRRAGAGACRPGAAPTARHCAVPCRN
jgi:DNA-binding transcriptional LysR family regulator